LVLPDSSSSRQHRVLYTLFGSFSIPVLSFKSCTSFISHYRGVITSIAGGHSIKNFVFHILTSLCIYILYVLYILVISCRNVNQYLFLHLGLKQITLWKTYVDYLEFCPVSSH
jgi:hypothetical protein